jgi:formylglycine-generating enzyme required for sulfatase activity
LDRRGFRLPTEHEWEIACRGDTGSAYGFGGDLAVLHRYAWYANSSEERGHLPRELRPNLRGLFDMHGNVWEWCHDWYGNYSEADTQDPIGTPRGLNRVDRGGGWYNVAAYSRSSMRRSHAPSHRQADLIGCRLALFPSSR